MNDQNKHDGCGGIFAFHNDIRGWKCRKCGYEEVDKGKAKIANLEAELAKTRQALSEQKTVNNSLVTSANLVLEGFDKIKKGKDEALKRESDLEIIAKNRWAKVEVAKAKVEKLEQVIRRLEWIRPYEGSQDFFYCPNCGAIKGGEHHNWCGTANALKEVDE